MGKEPAEKAKRVAALFGALLCYGEEAPSCSADSRPEEDVAVLAAVLRLLCQRSPALAGKRSAA